jgi:PAS domain S-box-containing protein
MRELCVNILYAASDLAAAALLRDQLRAVAPSFSPTIALPCEVIEKLDAPGHRTFDLLLADARLSDASLLALLRDIRGRALPLPIVVLGAPGDEAIVAAALRAGADDYLIVSGDDLSRLPHMLEQALRRHQAAAARLRQRRLLYVEPVLQHVEALRSHLACAAPQIELDSVAAAGEVLQRLVGPDEQPRYDALLLAGGLPGLGALELIKQLREREIPLILFVDSGEEDLGLAGIRLGASSYLVRHSGYLHQVAIAVEDALRRAELSSAEVAQRQSAEVELREMRFRTVWERATDAMVLTDADGIIQLANPAYLALLDRDAAEVVGHPFTRFVPQSERAQAEHAYLAMFQATDEVHRIEGLVSRRDMTERFVDVHASFVEQDGRRVAMLSIIRDVTERRRRDERLRLLESVVVNAGDAVLITEIEPIDEPGPRILYANTAFWRMTGYTEAEVLGQTPRMLQGPRTDRATLDQLRAALESRALFRGELINYRKDGAEFWIELDVVPVADETGRYTHAITIQRDISERKRAEAALRTSQALLQSIIDNSSAAIGLYDAVDERYLLVNRQLAARIGRTPDELLGQRYADFYAPEQVGRWQAENALIRTTGRSLQVDEQIISADGSVHTYLSIKFPIFDDRNQVYAIGGIYTNITDRKLDEELLTSTNAMLLQRVEELSLLNRIAQTVVSVTDLADALDIVCKSILRQFRVAIVMIDILNPTHTAASVLAHVEHAREPSWIVGQSNPLADDLVARRVLRRQQAVVIPKVRPVHLPPAIRTQSSDPPIQGLLVAPLRARGVIIGTLRIGADQVGRVFTPADVALAQTIAGLIASAIENTRLFAEEQRQRQLAESQREVAAVLTSSLDLETVLRTIYEQLRRVVEYDGGGIFLSDGTALVLTEAAGIGKLYLGHRIPLTDRDPAVQVFRHKRPLLIDDTSAHPDWIDWDTSEVVRSWIGAPLVIGETAIGVLTADHLAPHEFGAEDLQLLMTFASQAAIALENAQRYRRAHIVAADEERSRLARELHDSVTQTLFSATLVAEVLPELWMRQPEDGRQALDTLQRLARGALAEMRTLLLELRPAALLQARLNAVVEQLIVALSSRTPLVVVAELAPMPPLAPEVQVALYRLIQEALHNIVKHAGARRAELSLRAMPAVLGVDGHSWHGEIAIHIADDGKGFELAAVAPERMGLRIMRERAASIGADLRIDSAPGQGVQLTIVWRGAASPGERTP